MRGRRGRGLGSRAHPRLPLERLGARPWASRAAGELQATGQTDAGADQPARDRLTPQEHLIAMLAAAGLTNKEIGQQLFLSQSAAQISSFCVPELTVAKALAAAQIGGSSACRGRGLACAVTLSQVGGLCPVVPACQFHLSVPPGMEVRAVTSRSMSSSWL